jgi:two-component system NarL family response regulator
MIDILVVDDHHLFREGLVRVLKDHPQFQVIASLQSGEEAIAWLKKQPVDVVLMDVNMPGLGGVETTRQIHTGYPQVNILMLTISESESDLFASIRAGAHGYLLKSVTSKELVEAIQNIAAGEAAISPSMAKKLFNEFSADTSHQARRPSPQGELTSREFEILQLVAHGLSNKEIGTQLTLSPHTVKAHLRSILDKLHLRSRAEAAAWAAKNKSPRSG